MNGNDVVTEFKSFIQKVRLIIQPLFLSFPSVIFWYASYTFGFHSNSKADEPIVNAILPFIGGVHVFLASFLLYREGSDIRELKKILRRPHTEETRRDFMDIAEDMIPIPVKYILLSTGTMIQAWTIFLYYQNYYVGFFSVYSISYIITLIWEVIMDLDDPVHGAWVVKGIPKEWEQSFKIKKRWSDQIFDKVFGTTAAGRI